MLSYTVKILSVKPFPIKLNICDSIDCPVCESNLSDEKNIDLEKFLIDENTSIHCENCDTKIVFQRVKI